MTRLTLTTAALALIVSAALRAQSTTSAKVFYACYAPSSGAAHRTKEVGTKQECAKSTHVRSSWTDGAARPVTTVLGEIQTINANTNGQAVATCPPGRYATGGGYQLITFADSAQPAIHFSGPRLDPANTSWVVSVHNSVPNAVDVKMRAIVRCTR